MSINYKRSFKTYCPMGLCIIMLLIFGAFLTSCDIFKNTLFETNVDAIRSCPGGSGIFIVKINVSGDPFQGLDIDIECDDSLNAALYIVDSSGTDAIEIIVDPDSNITPGDYPLFIRGARGDMRDSLLLNVKIINWTDTREPGDLITAKLENYIDWLNSHRPDIHINHQTQWDLFATYPQTIIVDYFTLLNDEYELRVCNHAMIPPDDWSAIRLRERNVFDPLIALRQDSTSGAIYEIEVDEYPMLFGY